MKKIQVSVTGVGAALIVGLTLIGVGVWAILQDEVWGWMCGLFTVWVGVVWLTVTLLHSVLARGVKSLHAGGEFIPYGSITTLLVASKFYGFYPVLKYRKKVGDRRDVVLYGFWSSRASSANKTVIRLAEWLDVPAQTWDPEPTVIDSAEGANELPSSTSEGEESPSIHPRRAK